MCKTKESKLAAYRRAYAENPEKYLNRRKNRQIELTLFVHKKLGGRCSSPNCRHLNSDETLGCTDFVLLHIDHVNGGGTEECRSISRLAFLKKVLSDTEGNYQLLCANCNWLKRHTNREFKFCRAGLSGKTLPS